MRQQPASVVDRLNANPVTLFAVAGAVALAATALPPATAVQWALWAGAGLTVVLVALLPLGARLPAAWPLLPLLYLAALGLLRHADGGTASGLAPLVVMPMPWTALRGTRVQLRLTVLAIAVTLLVPVLLVGPPAYPAGEWQRIVVLVLLAPMVGEAVQRLVEEVRAAARTDALTGLPNRRTWDALLGWEFARATRSRAPLAVAVLDLDDFKGLNDSRGHPAGDAFLQAAARAWSAETRAADLLARLGGEEFALLLPSTPATEASAIVERLRDATPDDQTVSAGLAVWDGSETREQLMGRADQALYAAKAAGRDRLVLAE